MRLTDDHHKLIELLADVGDGRSKEEKSVDAGFAPKYVYQLLKKVEFCKALDDATTVSVRAHRARVYHNLLRASDNGDTAASTTFLKGAGDIVGGTQVTTNIKTGSEDGNDFVNRLRESEAKRDMAYDRERALRVDRDE